MAPGRVPGGRRAVHEGARGLRGALRPGAQAGLRHPAPLRRLERDAARGVRRLGGAALRPAVAGGGSARGDVGEQGARRVRVRSADVVLPLVQSKPRRICFVFRGIRVVI